MRLETTLRLVLEEAAPVCTQHDPFRGGCPGVMDEKTEAQKAQGDLLSEFKLCG